MSEVKYRGKQEFYFGDSVNGVLITDGPYKDKYFKSTYLDCLYFATDSREILMNGKPYNGDIYDTIMDDSLEMPNNVGGILKGTTVADLKNKTHNQLFDDILFPTILPTISPTNAPTFTLPTILKEVGSTISAKVSDTFTPNFNKGKIMLNEVSQGDYAGNYSWKDTYESITQGSVVIQTNEDGYYILSNNNTSYQCLVSYTIAAGTNIPKDNKGNTNTENSNIPAKYAGISSEVTGVIKTSAFVYATANTSTPTEIVKLRLKDHTVASNRIYTLTVAAHNPNNNPTIIKVPGTISNFYETDAGGNFVLDSLSKFTITTEVINGVTYKVYTQNDSGGGSRKIKFEFNN